MATSIQKLRFEIDRSVIVNAPFYFGYVQDIDGSVFKIPEGNSLTLEIRHGLGRIADMQITIDKKGPCDIWFSESKLNSIVMHRSVDSEVKILIV